jgi:hypothetical protein
MKKRDSTLLRKKMTLRNPRLGSSAGVFCALSFLDPEQTESNLLSFARGSPKIKRDGDKRSWERCLWRRLSID